MKTIGIRARVLLAALMPAMVVAVVLALLFMGVVIRDLDVTHQQRAVALTRQLASSAEFALFTRNGDALQGLVDAASAEPDLVSVSILDSQKALVVKAAGRGNQGNSYTVLEPVHATELRVDTMYDASSAGRDSAQMPLGFVALELSRRSVAERQRELAIAGLIATIGGLLFGWLVAMRLSIGVTRPIMQVSRMIERFGKGDMQVRLGTNASSPLHSLEEGINRMAERIEQNREDLERRVAAATAELRLKKDEAERANVSKSRFLAAASHDLRQPMHALRLFVEMLRDDLGEDSRAKPLLARVLSSVNSMSAMFDALLDISKLDAGVIPVRVQSFPVQDLLRQVELMFAPVAAQRGLRLRVLDSSAWIHSDQALLERLLQNLVSNALKYTQAGRVIVGCRRRAASLRIEVWDTGAGILPEHQQEVFQEFFRLEGVGSDADKGLGLGLAIVQRIAQLLHHPLSLRSSPGHGSVFTIEVPYGAHEAGAADAERLLASPPQLDGVRVGIIDDDPTILSATQELLERWGCAVECALSDDILLARLSETRAGLDFLVCDFRLAGGRDGIQAVARVRHALDAELPAILVTGDTASNRLQEADDSGLELLHKPVAPEQLRSVMHRLLMKGTAA